MVMCIAVRNARTVHHQRAIEEALATDLTRSEAVEKSGKQTCMELIDLADALLLLAIISMMGQLVMSLVDFQVPITPVALEPPSRPRAATSRS